MEGIGNVERWKLAWDASNRLAKGEGQGQQFDQGGRELFRIIVRQTYVDRLRKRHGTDSTIFLGRLLSLPF